MAYKTKRYRSFLSLRFCMVIILKMPNPPLSNPPDTVKTDTLYSEKSEKQSQAAFLEFVRDLTDSKVTISKNCSHLIFEPGTFRPQKDFDLKCPENASIKECMIAILFLAIFGSREVSGKLQGNTCKSEEISESYASRNLTRLVKNFMVKEKEKKVKSSETGFFAGPSGAIDFLINPLNKLQPLDLTDPGKVSKVKGSVFSTKSSPSLINRLIFKAKGIFQDFTPDVWIFDNSKIIRKGKAKTTKSKMIKKQSGFGIHLTAESTTGCILSGQKTTDGVLDSEQVAKAAAVALLKQIKNNGCIDSQAQPVFLLLMALADGYSRVKVGPLTKIAINCMRDIKAFFGVVFGIEEEKGGSVVLSCKGIGLRNLQKVMN